MQIHPRSGSQSAKLAHGLLAQTEQGISVSSGDPSASVWAIASVETPSCQLGKWSLGLKGNRMRSFCRSMEPASTLTAIAFELCLNGLLLA